MTTKVARAITGLVLTAALASGCGGGSGSGDAPAGGSGAGSDESSATPADPGQVGSSDCSLDREELSFVVRDWGRLFGSVGRGDHGTYTRAFVTRLEKTRTTAKGCTGTAELNSFLATARRIDDGARRPTPQYALYEAAMKHGNAWLAKIGYGQNALTVG